MTPSETLMDRKKYKQSQQYILSEPTLRENLRNTNITKKFRFDNLIKIYLDIRKEWNNIRLCRKSCERPDCQSEDFSPFQFQLKLK